MAAGLLRQFSGLFNDLGKLIGYRNPVNGQDESVGCQTLVQSGVPFVLPSSGSIADNGALTLTTALGVVYSGGAFMYFPANAIAAGAAAGWRWVVMSSTTVGVIYNNVYVSGNPRDAVPISPTAFATTGPGAYTQSTSEIIALETLIPGGTLGRNGLLRYFIQYANANSAGNKTYRSRLSTTAQSAGTAFQSGNVSTSAGTGVIDGIQNRNSEAAQVSVNGNNGAYGAAGQVVYGTLDTASRTYLQQTLQLAAATDYIVIEAFTVEAMYGA